MSYKPYSEDNPPQVGDIAVGVLSNVWMFVMVGDRPHSLLLASTQDPSKVGMTYPHAWNTQMVYQNFTKKGSIREL